VRRVLPAGVVHFPALADGGLTGPVAPVSWENESCSLRGLVRGPHSGARRGCGDASAQRPAAGCTTDAAMIVALFSGQGSDHRPGAGRAGLSIGAPGGGDPGRHKTGGLAVGAPAAAWTPQTATHLSTRTAPSDSLRCRGQPTIVRGFAGCPRWATADLLSGTSRPSNGFVTSDADRGARQQQAPIQALYASCV